MRQKIALFDRRRGSPKTPTSTRIPWRARRRKTEEPKPVSSSQSEFNSIRINTADYPIDLLRQYGEASSISHPISERDQRPPSSNTNELERFHSEERDSRLRRNVRRRPGECLFLTSGFRVNTTASANAKEILSATNGVNDGYDDGLFPFSEQSREGLFLRGKGCLLILFIILAFTTVVGFSWYYSCHSPLTKGSIHALVTGNPIAKLLGITSIKEKTFDARHMWINHVVKNDDNQILIAETIESRLNAEISPLLEKYVDKIWDDASSPLVTCQGEDRLMVAFSMTKAGLMPASVTYETPCMNGPSSRSCVVKKQIADIRDLIVRLPSKSSRYMHAVRLEVDHSSKDDPRNSSDVRHLQDLGTVSGQFRVELSDASRLALQRYCGQNRQAYSEDLMTEPVSARNTRLINVYELKRLYGLLSSQSDMSVSGSNAWDTRMLSTVVVDPLEHSRHSLAPVHVQQLLSRLGSGVDSESLHEADGSRSPGIAVSSPQENDLNRQSAQPSPQVLAKNNDVVGSAASPISHSGLPLSSTPSTPSPSPPLSSPSPAQMNTTQHITSFNFQTPNPRASGTEEKLSQKKSPLPSHGNSTAVQLQRTSGDDSQFSPTNDETVRDTENEQLDRTMVVDGDKAFASDQESSDGQGDTTSDEATTGNSKPTASDQSGPNNNATSNVIASPQRQAPVASSKRSEASPGNKSPENPPHVGTEGPRAHRSARGDSPASVAVPQAATNDAISVPTLSLLSQSLPPSGTSITEHGTPSASKLTPSTSVSSSRLSAGPKEREKGLVARPVTGTQIVNTETAVTRGAAIRKQTNIVHGSTTPNSAIHAPTLGSLSSPEERSSPPLQGGQFLNQESSTSQTVSSPRTEISPAQTLPPPVKGSSTSSAEAMSPIQETSSPMYARSPLAHGSSSRTQGTSSSMQGSMTSAGAAPTPKRGVTRRPRRTNNGLLATQKVLKSSQRNPLPRGAQPQRGLPRTVARTQMITHQPKQPYVGTRAGQSRSGTKSSAKSEPISVLGVLDSRFHPKALNQMRKPEVRSRIP